MFLHIGNLSHGSLKSAPDLITLFFKLSFMDGLDIFWEHDEDFHFI